MDPAVLAFTSASRQRLRTPVSGLDRRVTTLERKRKEYLDAVRQAFNSGTMANRNGSSAGLTGLASQPPVTAGRGRGLDEAVWHQISIDIIGIGIIGIGIMGIGIMGISIGWH